MYKAEWGRVKDEASGDGGGGGSVCNDNKKLNDNGVIAVDRMRNPPWGERKRV